MVLIKYRRGYLICCGHIVVDTSTVEDIVDATNCMSIDTSFVQLVQSSWRKW